MYSTALGLLPDATAQCPKAFTPQQSALIVAGSIDARGSLIDPTRYLAGSSSSHNNGRKRRRSCPICSGANLKKTSRQLLPETNQDGKEIERMRQHGRVCLALYGPKSGTDVDHASRKQRA